MHGVARSDRGTVRGIMRPGIHLTGDPTETTADHNAGRKTDQWRSVRLAMRPRHPSGSHSGI